MFTVNQNGENRLDIEFSGKIDSETMGVALDDLIAKSQKVENGTMLFRVGDFDLPTLGAIGVELSRLPKLLMLVGKFDRAAVITKKGWIKTGSEIKGALIPGLEIKAFEPDQEEVVEAWLSESEPKALFNFVTKGDNRLDFEFSGKLDTQTMKVALDDFAEKAMTIENGRMLCRVGEYHLPTLGAIRVELSRMPKLLHLIGNFDKAAVLANQNWIRVISQIEGALIPGLEIKAFELDQEAEAETWLKNP